MKCKNCNHDLVQNGNVGYLHAERRGNLIMNVETECECGCTNPVPLESEKENEL